ncbi:zinc finger BED domain-containing protein RICESLEEPER 2-like protein [Tanacetum coccineum]
MDMDREMRQGDDTNTTIQVDDVWPHFDRKVINGELKAECKYCQKQLARSSRSRTSHLREHITNRCKRRKTKDIRQQVLSLGHKTPGGPSNLSCYSFDVNISRQDLAEMIIVHEYPLVMVEHHGFRKLVRGLQPLFRKNASRIAITTDMWTSSNQKKGFMTITAHYIDDNWNLQSRLMRFIYVPCPHTADVLANVLYESLCDWNIDRKISTVTVDNCTTNDAMIRDLLDKLPLSSLILGGELFHMRCYAYILNLIVQDGLSVLGDGIDRVRDSVSYWTATAKRVEKFEEAAHHLEIPSSRTLALDCKTRWNSTYLMLEVAIIYKVVFRRLKQRDARYPSVPIERDRELASNICKKLKLFYNVTLMFSGTKYPTTNTFFTSICDIRYQLNKWKHEEDQVIKDMAKKMILKFDKYWSDIHGFMGVAVVLDPLMKLKIMKFSFPKLYPSL